MSAVARGRTLPNKPNHYSESEWKVRCDLAACYRLIAHYRMTDHIYTHISVRDPDNRDHFLINPYGMTFDEITASSLVKIDHEGRKVEASPHEVNPAGFTIHSAVHAAREDAACVLHTHTRAGVAVSCMKEGLLPLNQIALQFYGPRLAYHDYEGIALDLDERERLAADLGTARALVLRNHGLLTAGRSVAEAFSLMFYLNRACEIQVDVCAMKQPFVLPSPEVCEHTARQYDEALGSGTHELDREWEAHLRLLSRANPGWNS
ncbi:MAG TPA: class II aldolase/adducin family protein [Kiloniellales bacterium]|nr:class II aldolase/adducin family protein [Kiloniellales bacterium]